MRLLLHITTVIMLTALLAACDATTRDQVRASDKAATPVTLSDATLQKWSQSCALCHVNGEGGAPRMGDAKDWAGRREQGAAILLQHTLEGYNNMPPLGYCMACEQADFESMIQFMAGGSQ